MDKETFNKLTPAMRHYVETKQLNPDAFLFYRLGDFYELFFEDAVEVSRLLDLTLTRKSGGLEEKIPMCGVPYRVANQYVSKLIRMGYKVAICDQVEDAKEAKGLVRREITRIVTPATFTDTQYLDKNSNQYLMSLWIKGHTVSLAYCDYLSGEFYIDEDIFLSNKELREFLDKNFSYVKPVELLYIQNLPQEDLVLELAQKHSNPLVTRLDRQYLDRSSLLSLGLFSKKLDFLVEEKKVRGQEAIYFILNYLEKTQMNSLQHLTSLTLNREKNYMDLSENTKYNLELIKSIYDQSKKNTLFELLDECITSMGTRLIRNWIQKPLTDLKEIRLRQDTIKAFHNDRIKQDSVRRQLKEIYDFDRLAVKISQKSLTPRDLDQLRRSLDASNKLRESLFDSESQVLQDLGYAMPDMGSLVDEISSSIMEDPPLAFTEERFIIEGFDSDLDRLFEYADGGLEWLVNLETSEQERTGIKNLKIKYNKILGYFFEVTKSNLSMVPDNYIRKQTLVGSERYYSMELKEKEAMILSGKEEAYSRQMEILSKLREAIFINLVRIQELAHFIARVDSLLSLSFVADKYKYTCPDFNIQGILDISAGRHPMVENHLNKESYVPNNVYMDGDKYRIQIITGPNMAGKSTYMRQTAILCIMAQMGSFVPASRANLPILDQIFTRIGASDNLASGQSTFMVEMMEVAHIISNASKDSLILLDEVGRGTSTHDGLSIASALVEYLSSKSKTKTFFATHYHELTELGGQLEGIYNLTIATEEREGEIRFLRKIIPGASNHSYGIEVAKLAGVDKWITDRAYRILSELEKSQGVKINPSPKKQARREETGNYGPLIERIQALDINSITPLESLDFLNKLKGQIEEGSFE